MDGANIPPEPPEPMLILVANIFAIRSPTSIIPNISPRKIWVTDSYPTPKIWGKIIPMHPIIAPPIAGLIYSGNFHLSKKSSIP